MSKSLPQLSNARVGDIVTNAQGAQFIVTGVMNGVVQLAPASNVVGERWEKS